MLLGHVRFGDRHVWFVGRQVRCARRRLRHGHRLLLAQLQQRRLRHGLCRRQPTVHGERRVLQRHVHERRLPTDQHVVQDSRQSVRRER
jgi:hypothetical protein